MTLQEIFDQLTYGELSQISIGGGEAGVIDANNHERVLSYVNLALLALYKRFPLKEAELTVQLMPPLREYQLHSQFAFANLDSYEPIRYIMDTASSPFQDDLLKVERVYGDSGFEFSLNNLDDIYSIRTPRANFLVAPQDIVEPPNDLADELKTEQLRVAYRAKHPILRTQSGELEPDEVEVELPYSHLEPLLLFIAARAHTPLGMQGTEGNLGNLYMQKYELACQQLEILNLRVDQGSQANRLQRNGWV